MSFIAGGIQAACKDRMRGWLVGCGVMAAVLMRALAAVPAGGAEFPFELRDGMIRIEVHAGVASEPLHFLFDTGAGASVLNLRAVKRLKLPLGCPVRVQGVEANSLGYWPVPLAADIAGVTLPGNYVGVDLSALSGACECPVDGLIGADFLRNQTVRIDFLHRRIQVLSQCPGNQAGESLRMRIRHGVPQVQIRVDGSDPAWVRLDTGCASGLHWVTSRIPQRPSSSQTAVALTRVVFPMAPTSVQLGRVHLEGVPTGFHEKPIFPGESGLLGNGLLSRFRSITLAPQAGRLFLEER